MYVALRLLRDDGEGRAQARKRQRGDVNAVDANGPFHFPHKEGVCLLVLRLTTPRRVGALIPAPQRSVAQLGRDGREYAVLVHVSTVPDVGRVGGKHDLLGAGSQEVYALIGRGRWEGKKEGRREGVMGGFGRSRAGVV